MTFPPGYRYDWYIIAHDYNFHSHDNNFREMGTCNDGNKWHRLANTVQPCNVLVKFDYSEYKPPE